MLARQAPDRLAGPPGSEEPPPVCVWLPPPARRTNLTPLFQAISTGEPFWSVVTVPSMTGGVGAC